MPNLARVRAVWTGSAVVGPGVSTFYFDEAAEGFQADVGDFFDAIDDLLPTNLGISVAPTGDLIDVATGALSGTWSEGTTALTTGAAGGGIALGVGGRIVWDTDGINDGRRVRGSTFIAPLAKGFFDADGNLSEAVLGFCQGAADALIAAQAGNMKIYSRPRPGRAGSASTVTAARVPDAISWLRSRRT